MSLPLSQDWCGYAQVAMEDAAALEDEEDGGLEALTEDAHWMDLHLSKRLLKV